MHFAAFPARIISKTRSHVAPKLLYVPQAMLVCQWLLALCLQGAQKACTSSHRIV